MRSVHQEQSVDVSTSPHDSAEVGGPPFMAEDVLRTRSLAQALAKLVFAHASVHEAYASAKSRALKEGTYAQLDEYAALIGTFYGHDEPLLALRYFAEDSYDL